MSAENARTPYITWFKEIVAAGLGVLIVAGIFWLLWPPLTQTTPDIETAQAIFSILGGWGGIVIGYYFGRLPAEKMATKAEAAAATAEMAKDAAVTNRNTELAEHKETLAGIEETLEMYKKNIADLLKRIDEL